MTKSRTKTYVVHITIKKIDDYKNVYCVNPLYLIFGKVDGFIEEKNGSKYLVFDSTDENKKIFKKYTEVWDMTKIEIVAMNGSKASECGKDFLKIKFTTDDDFPLNKLLNLNVLTIVVRHDFEEDGKFYLQIYLDEYLHKL